MTSDKYKNKRRCFIRPTNLAITYTILRITIRYGSQRIIVIDTPCQMVDIVTYLTIKQVKMSSPTTLDYLILTLFFKTLVHTVTDISTSSCFNTHTPPNRNPHPYTHLHFLPPHTYTPHTQTKRKWQIFKQSVNN